MEVKLKTGSISAEDSKLTRVNRGFLLNLRDCVLYNTYQQSSILTEFEILV